MYLTLSTTRVSSGLIDLQSNVALRDSKKEISYFCQNLLKEPYRKLRLELRFSTFHNFTSVKEKKYYGMKI